MRMIIYQMSPIPRCIDENATPWEAFTSYIQVLAKLTDEKSYSYTPVDFDWFVESLVCKHEVSLCDLDDKEILHIFVVNHDVDN